MKLKKELSVKTIVAIGIGSALFVILGKFVVIPTGFPNTNIETTYPFLALMAVLYGPIAGALIGVIGHTLKDFMTYGGAWWSWIICSGMLGFLFGVIGKQIPVKKGKFTVKNMIFFNVTQAIANVSVWALLAPTLDILIYQEPANKVYVQGIISATVNTIAVGIIGTLLLKTYASSQVKSGSLKKDL